MSRKTENVKALIEALTPAELQSLAAYLRSKLPKHALEQKWGIGYEVILDAIHRAPDLTQRGVRGVIAEAVFEARVLPSIAADWHAVPVIGDLPYDFDMRRNSDDKQIKIQVKLQRMKQGKPFSRLFFGPDTFIVEVQKTRTGTARKGVLAISDNSEPISTKTRPYRFGDFDVLAVNMHPSTQDWTRFMYTVGSWLIPKPGDGAIIDTFQPVSRNRSDLWTDNIQECINWFLSGEKKTIFDLQAAKCPLFPAHPAKQSSRRSRTQ